MDPQAIGMLEEALALYKALGDKSGRALSIHNMSHAVAHVEDYAGIATLREEAEALLEEPLDRRAAAHLLMSLAISEQLDGAYERVMARGEEASALFREVGDIRNCAMCLNLMGIAALMHGDAGRAAALYEEELRLLRELRDKVGTVYGLLGMAGVDTLQGRPARAGRLFGAADALRESIGHPLTPLERINYAYESYLATVRGSLGEVAFDAAWTEGRAMSPEQAIEYALGTEEPSLPAAPNYRPAPDVLTRRQREVAALIGRGFTNHQIATELSITERTVETHVGKILRKLGVHSRTRIATWMMKQS